MSFTNSGSGRSATMTGATTGGGSGTPTDLSASPATIPAVATTTSGPISTEGALSFTGTGIQINSSKFPFDWWTGGGFTVEAWVKYTSFTNALGSGVVPQALGLMQPAGNIADWALGPNGSGTIQFYYYSAGQNTKVTANAMTTGTWTHICAQHDGTNFHMYINGVRSHGPTAISGLVTVSTTHSYFGLGQYFNGAGPTYQIADLRLVRGANVYPVTGFTAPTSKLTVAPVGTTVFLLQVPLGSSPGTMIGSPLTSRISSSPIGAFSLRAVTAPTVRAVQVTQYALLEVPPVGLTQNTFTATGTYNGVTNGQYIALCSSYDAVSDAYRVFDKNNGTRGLTTGGYTIGTGVYTGSSTTVDSTSSTYNGGWFQIKIPGAIFPISYSVSVHSSLTLTAPYTWKLFGSTTGSPGSWVVLDTQTAYTFASQTVNFTLASTVLNGYTYFRLAANMTSPSSSANDYGPSELKIYGYSSLVSTAQDFYADRLGNLLTAPVSGQPLQSWLGGATGYLTTWYDQTVNGRNATGTQATIVRTSNVNQQWAVNPTNGGLSLSGGAFLNGTDFTIACTTKRLGTQGNDGVYGYGANASWVAQASVPTTYGDNTRFGLVMPNAGSTSIAFNDSSYSAAFSSNANVLPSTFVAATEPTIYTAVTLTGAQQRMYINGTANGAPISTLTQVTANASTGFTIGGVNYYGNFLGEIGELLIFNSALSAADISTLYSAR